MEILISSIYIPFQFLILLLHPFQSMITKLASKFLNSFQMVHQVFSLSLVLSLSPLSGWSVWMHEDGIPDPLIQKVVTYVLDHMICNTDNNQTLIQFEPIKTTPTTAFPRCLPSRVPMTGITNCLYWYNIHMISLKLQPTTLRTIYSIWGRNEAFSPPRPLVHHCRLLRLTQCQSNRRLNLLQTTFWLSFMSTDAVIGPDINASLYLLLPITQIPVSVWLLV